VRKPATELRWCPVCGVRETDEDYAPYCSHLCRTAARYHATLAQKENATMSTLPQTVTGTEQPTVTTVALTPTAPTVTTEQLELIKRTVAADATPDELKLYLYDCARQGVHPLDKLIFFTKRKGKYTPITSIDFMRIRAADSGDLAGSDDALFSGTPGRADFAATVTVWRIVQGARCPFVATARWSEYKPDQAFMWEKMPHTMLAKCAEALALRKGFPRQLSGLYAKEEMEQADNTTRRPLVAPASTSPAGEPDAAPPGTIVVKALRPSTDVLIKGIIITQQGEELLVTKDDVWALAQELHKSGAPMVADMATKNRRTFVRSFMSPEAVLPRPAPAPMPDISADDIPF
jgi:phage recombination protein Bet